jgi:hypothetical protein
MLAQAARRSAQFSATHSFAATVRRFPPSGIGEKRGIADLAMPHHPNI